MSAKTVLCTISVVASERDREREVVREKYTQAEFELKNTHARN